MEKYHKSGKKKALGRTRCLIGTVQKTHILPFRIAKTFTPKSLYAPPHQSVRDVYLHINENEKSSSNSSKRYGVLDIPPWLIQLLKKAGAQDSKEVGKLLTWMILTK